MKADLEQLMAKNNVDAILVTGPAQHNPAMVYLAGICHLTNADLLVKRGEKGVLFYAPMERDEAVGTGLKTICYNDFPYKELLTAAKGNNLRANALRYQRMLTSQGLTKGRLLVYGEGDAGTHLAVFNALKELLPGLEYVEEPNGPLLQQAMATKDADEVDHIRRMGQTTTEIAGMVQDFLSSQTVKDGSLVDKKGAPVTIGRIKRMINLWLAERDAENPEGTIFSQGRDAGVPHSTGKDDEPLQLGKTIVFDFYPCEAGGGYFYDFTRTWCLGYAPDEVYKVYEDVRSVYNQVYQALEVGAPCVDYQVKTCELFEKQGYATVLHDPNVQEGYVHSLGHGVGLHIHEQPWFNGSMGTQDVIRPGAIFTLEPGLYFPQRGFGIRLEDTIYVTPQGKFEILANYPMELVIPVK